MSTNLNRVIVSVTDLASSQAFYVDLLGFAHVATQGDMSILRISAGLDLNLHQRPTTISDAAVALSFAVDDVDGVCASWAQACGVIIDEPDEQPWGERMAVVRDPDGHIVCLVQRRDRRFSPEQP